MKTLNTQAMIRRMFALLCTMMLLGFVATPAFAETDNENACAKAAKDAGKAASKEGKELAALHSKMRSACAEFRGCKKTCRASKRNCKSDARSNKGQCIANCSKIGNKRKRNSCKKSCRASKRSSKSSCRQEKRACKTVCVATEKKPACRAARRAFWNKAGKVGGKFAQAVTKQCVKEYSKN